MNKEIVEVMMGNQKEIRGIKSEHKTYLVGKSAA